MNLSQKRNCNGCRACDIGNYRCEFGITTKMIFKNNPVNGVAHLSPQIP